MKIKSIISKPKNKLIELQILKSKIYKNYKKKKIEHSAIKLYLKKIANIIYEYHINNKTILFINLPPKLEKSTLTLNKNIKHIFLSKENWINGVLMNKSVSINSKLIQTANKSKFKSKKNFFFDLIVIFNPTNIDLFSENYNSNIPTILITDELFNKNSQLFEQSYKILGYFKFIEEQINNNFFFSILQSIFKQSIIKKKLQKYKNVNNKLARKKKKSFKKYASNKTSIHKKLI